MKGCGWCWQLGRIRSLYNYHLSRYKQWSSIPAAIDQTHWCSAGLLYPTTTPCCKSYASHSTSSSLVRYSPSFHSSTRSVVSSQVIWTACCVIAVWNDCCLRRNSFDRIFSEQIQCFEVKVSIIWTSVTQVLQPLQEFRKECPETQILLQPAVGDAHHVPVHPQPPFPRASLLEMIPSPAHLHWSQFQLSVTSSSVFMDLSVAEVGKHVRIFAYSLA
jgi:hypothetical protein